MRPTGSDPRPDPSDRPGRPAAEESGALDRPPGERVPAEHRLFQHQPWMVGLILIFAMAAIVAGLSNPVWWLIGSPCILALALYVGARFMSSR